MTQFRADEGLAFMLQYENVAWYENGKVRILDRRIYPTEVRFVECATYQEVVQAIADMVTQSAGPYTAVGMGMALAAEADDSNGLAVQHAEVAVGIVVFLDCHKNVLLFSFRIVFL